MLWSPKNGPSSHFLLAAARKQVENGCCALTDDANEADMILVSEIDSRRPLADTGLKRLYCQYAERLFFYSTDDRAIPWIPGIYASIEKQLYMPARMRAGFYPLRVPAVTQVPDVTGSEPFLACFAGAVATHPVRRRLLLLDRSCFLVSDMSAHPARIGAENAANDMYQGNYCQALHQSLFGLCPRGNGTSSVRLFECMAAGRAPVIISDDWVAPDGPEWDAFSLRVSEHDVATIEEKLRALRPRAQEMGVLARAAYQRWFSVEHAMETIMKDCMGIQSERRGSERRHRLLALSYFRSPFYLRHHLKPFLMDTWSSMLWSLRHA